MSPGGGPINLPLAAIWLPEKQPPNLSLDPVQVNMANRPLMAAMQNLRLGSAQVRKSRSDEDIAQKAQAQAEGASQMPMSSSLKPPLQRWVNEAPRANSSLRMDQTWHQSTS